MDDDGESKQLDALPGRDGRLYYPPDTAQRRTDLGEKALESLAAEGEIRKRPREVVDPARFHGPGRRPQHLFDAEDIERIRGFLLERVGAVEELRSARAEAAGLRTKVDDLERQQARMSEEVAGLREALRSGVVADEAHLDQIRHLLALSETPGQSVSRSKTGISGP